MPSRTDLRLRCGWVYVDSVIVDCRSATGTTLRTVTCYVWICGRCLPHALLLVPVLHIHHTFCLTRSSGFCRFTCTYYTHLGYLTPHACLCPAIRSHTVGYHSLTITRTCPLPCLRFAWVILPRTTPRAYGTYTPHLTRSYHLDTHRTCFLILYRAPPVTIHSYSVTFDVDLDLRLPTVCCYHDLFDLRCSVRFDRLRLHSIF